jgi:hypothetical protein
MTVEAARMLDVIIATTIVKEKLEDGMLKRFANRVKLWIWPEIDVTFMRESFYRAFRG